MENLESEFEKRKPWVTRFTINGKKYGGELSFDNDSRISLFFDCFPEVHSILELGSFEGGQTVQLAKRADISVLGIEGRINNVTKSTFVCELMDLNNVKFVCANLKILTLSDFGSFNAVFCSGLLYHMPKPLELVREISKITSKVFICTHYAGENKVNAEIDGCQGCWYNEFGYNDPLSGLSKRSFWMTCSSPKKSTERVWL
jgi:hypothetical protein